jgi:hypothetical protein
MRKGIPLLHIILSILLFPLQHDLSAQIYVAVNGADNNAGTKQQPLASLAKAVRKARELRRLNDPSVKEGLHIIIEDGNYQLDETLFIKPEDAGAENSVTTIEAASGARPVISGGTPIKGWKKTAGNIPGLPLQSKGKIWVADAPLVSGRLLEFRQLWVNNVKAIRAKERNGDSMHRILSWDHQAEQCWIPRPKTNDVTAAEGLEMFVHQWWAIAILRIKKVEVQGDSMRLSFHQPESRIQSEHPWPAPWLSKETGNSAFYLMNALQFLDEPGEWFLDMKNRKVYYYPRPGENVNAAEVIAPALETLVKIQGTADQPVRYLSFKGISFRHTSWLRPSMQGHVPHQAGMYMLEAYKLKIPGTADKKTLENQAWVGRPAAAIDIGYARQVGFENCYFQHLASTALDYNKGTGNSIVDGNLFSDIGGAAILAGTFSDEATEVHLPYNPSDETVICSSLRISNNLINNVTNEDWGTVAIGAGYVRDISIEHNDISEISYSGISLGWGWTRTSNVMKNNKVHANKIHRYARHMYDVAGIYTLSAQPGTVISANEIDSVYKAPYAHLPSHWFYIYTDEGSSYMTIRDNHTPSEKYLQNANGPGNSWLNNGPAVNDSIKQQAGLLPAYRGLLTLKTIVNKQWPIVHELPVIIELIIGGRPFDINALKQLLQNNKADTSAIYQWQDHYVIFDKVQDVSVLSSRIRDRFPGVEVKIYYDVFYEFNRSRCADKSIAAKWDHVILTANLAVDPQLQKEYLDHHATQFEKWPELSAGFCNASFQQLLIYRNQRQLMLVISIPKGKSLAELNPKTTENNPRVETWNNLMKKYQEGISGTKPGEVWVQLKRVMSDE